MVPRNCVDDQVPLGDTGHESLDGNHDQTVHVEALVDARFVEHDIEQHVLRDTHWPRRGHRQLWSGRIAADLCRHTEDEVARRKFWNRGTGNLA
eukprot:605329-Lingulodinium_polyedra.AAC.1